MALGGLPPRVVIGQIIDGKHRRADLAVIGATCPRASVCAFFRDARHNCAGSTAFGTALFAMLEVIYVYYTSRVLAPLAYRLRVQEEPRYPYVVLMSCLIL